MAVAGCASTSTLEANKINSRKFKSVTNIPKHPSVRTRLVLLLIGMLILGLLSLTVTGSLVPADNDQALVFQGGFLLVVFGSLFLEDKFTKPADAVINSIAAIISLIPVYASNQNIIWYLIICYVSIVMIIGIVNLALITHNSDNGWIARVRSSTYFVSTTLGKSNVIFSVVFLYAVFSFYGLRSQSTAVLLVFWGVYIALWPLKIPHLLEALFSKPSSSSEKGTIARVDYPDLIKVRLYQKSRWSGEIIAGMGDGKNRKVLPIYTQVQDAEVIGTGILTDVVDTTSLRIRTGFVYHDDTLSNEDGNHDDDEPDYPIGVISHNTRIAKIYFETWKPEVLSEGTMVHCTINGKTIYYQVTDAATVEETFERHRHGFQMVEAHQLGTFHKGEGFKKFTWLPQMNTPIFLSGEAVQGARLELPTSDLSVGRIPGSDVEIICDIDEMISHHTAILGVTGSGKTELAFKIIQRAIDNGVKIFCVDITGQYIEKLSRFSPTELSIDESLADQLGKKLHEVETGKYGAGDEKKALKEFADRLRADIDGKVKSFLDNDDSIGIFTMPSISNTKATIQATEIYLSSIFKYGREITEEKQRILVVLEEAHTVVPEASTMGLGDYDSRGMVAKIAQIALQGRKYEVGLLVIAQRTATVSKTVLTQCNTVITFASFDQTGLAFLSNIYGEEHTSKISNLPFLHALMFGKGVRSERPVVVELPFDESLTRSKDTTN